MQDYSNKPMGGISDSDYEKLHSNLTEQLAAVVFADRQGSIDEIDCSGMACDALANSWQPDMTASEWLKLAGERLGVDTSGCVGP